MDKIDLERHAIGKAIAEAPIPAVNEAEINLFGIYVTPSPLPRVARWRERLAQWLLAASLKIDPYQP